MLSFFILYFLFQHPEHIKCMLYKIEVFHACIKYIQTCKICNFMSVRVIWCYGIINQGSFFFLLYTFMY